MRDNIVAIAAAQARSLGERERASGGDEHDVIVAVMRAALGNFLAPTEDEAFAAGVAASMEVYPERRDTILAEARSIGDRAKILNALASGVPVDLERATVAPMPDDALGLIALFEEARR